MIQTNRSDELTSELRRTVKPAQGQVSARIFTNDDVYRRELDAIFTKVWLFVAHETELPHPGDYVTRQMAEHSVIVARGDDGVVRVFLNSCRHRGRKVCRADAGTATNFRCPYHGFTYKNSGELIGAPFFKEVYGDLLDWEGMALYEARADSYAGLIFATWNREGPSLKDYLGNMCWYLDFLFARTQMEVVDTPQRWNVPTNWKIPAENFGSDAYHTAYTHASAPALGLSPSIGFGKDGWQICAGNGHTLGIGVGTPGSPVPLSEEVIADIDATLPPEQADLMKRARNIHGNIFPNLSFLLTASFQLDPSRPVSFLTFRQWQPRGANEIEAYSWVLMDKSTPPGWRDAALQAYTLTFGPGGIAEQDDAENWGDVNAAIGGPLADDLTFNYVMGLDREPTEDFIGPGTVYEGKFCEAAARHFYGRWLELCT